MTRSANTSRVASLWWQVNRKIYIKKNKKKTKTGGFVLLWLIKNNAYFSLQLGSAFCPRTLLLISNLTRRRNGLLASFPVSFAQ